MGAAPGRCGGAVVYALALPPRKLPADAACFALRAVRSGRADRHGVVVCCKSPFRQSKLEKPAAPRPHTTRRGKDENQVSRWGVDGVISDGGSGTRSDAGGEGQGVAISGNDEEECSGGHERTVGSAVELQAGAGPLVGSAGDGAHCRGRRFYPRNVEGEGDDRAGGGAGARREENRRGGASDGSGPHKQSASTGTAGTDKPFRVTGRLSQAFRGEPRGNRRFSKNRDGSARSRDGQSAGKAGWV